MFYECIIDSVHDVDKQSFFLKDNNTVTERFEKTTDPNMATWQPCFEGLQSSYVHSISFMPNKPAARVSKTEVN